MAPGRVLSDGRSHAELAAALPLVSRGAITDLLLLEEGARSLVRLSCPATAVGPVTSALSARGHEVRCFRHALRPAIALGGGGYVLSSVPDARFDEPDARAFLFVSRDGDLAEVAERFALDDAVLGGLLGYPTCCVLSYARHRDHHARRLEPSFARPSSAPLPYWTNTMLDALGWHLVSHFPCQPGCAATERLAMTSFRALAARDALHAVELLCCLRSIVLVSPELGLLFGKPGADRGGAIELRILGASPPWHERLGGSAAATVEQGSVRAGHHPIAHGVELFDFTGDHHGR